MVVSLKKNYEFRRLYTRGKSAGNSLLVMYQRRNGSQTNRLGITVGGKVGGAVVRNRVRRRIREIYRLGEGRLKRGYDIVIVARVRAKDASYDELERALWGLARRMELLA